MKAVALVTGIGILALSINSIVLLHRVETLERNINTMVDTEKRMLSSIESLNAIADSHTRTLHIVYENESLLLERLR